MIKFEKAEVVGWEHAIRGMRNPMNSWDKSDTAFYCYPEETVAHKIGENDLDLMLRLIKGGTDHRKFMRMIVVYCDITAPLYWWKEFDTYQVGVVKNSCSTMHKIHEKEFTLEDFSIEHCEMLTMDVFIQHIIPTLNIYRKLFCGIESGERKGRKSDWWQMIQLLPSSYNQKRTVMLNYEVLANMYKSRKNHKLDEWVDFCKWIESLPYSELITGAEEQP